MRLSNNLPSRLISVLIGAGIGFVSSPIFVWVLWVIVSLAIGWICTNGRTAVVNGARYGFALSFTFLVLTYMDTQPLGSKLVNFVVLSLLGALCGMAFTHLGYRIRNDLYNKRLSAPDQE